MNAQLVISLVAIFIAGLSSIVTAVTLRRKTDDTFTADLKDYAESLEKRIESLKGEQIVMQRDLDDCKRARDGFEDKNFQLLQEVYDLRKKVEQL